MSSIESEDDFWVWVDYVAEITDSEGGLDIGRLNLNGDSTMLAENPLPWMVPDAHAIRLSVIPLAFRKIVQQVRILIQKIPLGRSASVTAALRVIKNNPVLYRLVLKSGAAIRYFAVLGAARITYFIRESRNWRVNRWFVLFSIVFLEEELAAGRLTLQNGGLTGVIAKVFSRNRNDSAGALFQLSQISYYHGKSLLSDTQPEVLAIEEIRPAYRVTNGQSAGLPYRRRVDIIVESVDKSGENWIEVKSLIKSAFVPSQFKNDPTTPRSTKYKEFFHDLRLNEDIIITTNAYRDIILSEPNASANEEYTWYFHDWRRGNGVSPTNREEGKVRDFLCARPTFAGVRDFYRFNMDKTPAATESACTRTSRLRIQLRNTESYITEIALSLVPLLGDEISEYVDMVRSIPVDSEWY